MAGPLGGAAAALIPGAKGATVSILGMKVSWDAILVAGAGLVGVIFLYKLGQPSGQIAPSSTVDPSGGGADATMISTVPADTPQNAYNNYGSSRLISGGSAIAGSSDGTGATQQTTSTRAGLGGPTTGIDAGTSYVPGGGLGTIVSRAVAQAASAARSASPAPSRGGFSNIINRAVAQASASAAAGPPKPPPTVAGGGGGSFTA